MTIEKHNSLQFLFLDRARFEVFDEKDGVLVRNVPYELRDRLLKWMWLHPSSRERYFFDDDRGLVVTRTGWERYINWVRRALDEKFSNDRHNSPKSAVATLVPPLGKRPTLPQLIKEQEMEEEPGVRIVCISDTHNFHAQIDVPDGDVLIIAGDVCVRGSVYELAAVNEFLGGLPHRHKLLVAGNHDWCFANHAEREEARKLLKNVTYLQDSGIEIDGVKYWGSPWQPEFHDWAFNLPRGKKLAEVWAKIPSNIDVLITHTPPFGILDKNGNGDHVGCGALLDALSRIQPRIHVFGHIHESYGTIEAEGTTFINACICDGQYRPINQPIVIDLRQNS